MSSAPSLALGRSARADESYDKNCIGHFEKIETHLTVESKKKQERARESKEEQERARKSKKKQCHSYKRRGGESSTRRHGCFEIMLGWTTLEYLAWVIWLNFGPH